MTAVTIIIASWFGLNLAAFLFLARKEIALRIRGQRTRGLWRAAT